jgi:type III secretory pathway component EscV
MRTVAATELEVIVQDLGLDAEFRIDVRMAPNETQRESALVLYVDGKPLPPDGRSTSDIIRAYLRDLISPQLIDHMWTKWGGRSVAPPAFGHLVRDLVHHRVRPDRVSHAVATWRPDEDPLLLFEEALNKTSRKISVHVHPAGAPQLETAFVPEKDSAATMMVDSLFYELGVVLGQCELVKDKTQQAGSIRVRINDLRSASMSLIGPDECMVNDTAGRLALLRINGREAVHPANGSECAIIPKADAALAELNGITTWDAGGWTILCAAAEVRRSAPAMLNLDAVQSLLDRLETAFPYLVSYVKNRIDEKRFARMLRQLLNEGLSIRNMPHIINGVALAPPQVAALVDFSGWTPDLQAAEMAEQARVSLRRDISHKYTHGGDTLVVYLLDRVFEERLADRRSLSAAERRWLLDAFRAKVRKPPLTDREPCVLTRGDIRRRVRNEIEASFPQIPVLSYQELSPDKIIQLAARISPASALAGFLDSDNGGNGRAPLR